MYKNLLLIGLTFILCSCQSTVLEFNTLAIENIDLASTDLQTTRQVSAQGQDSRVWFLFIPFGSSPSIHNTMLSALRNGQGTFCKNGAVDSYWWTIGLFSYEKYIVNTNVARTQ